MTARWLRQLPPTWAWPGIFQHQLQYRFGLKPNALTVTHAERTEWQTSHRTIANVLANNAAAFLKTYPAQTEQLQQTANALLNGRYNVLGHTNIELTELNWSKDFITGFDWASGSTPTAGSDIKRPWELARCHHLVTLAQAYALTQDAKYNAEVARQITHWITHNPIDTGIHWRNPMEVSIRSANWLFAIELCGGLRTFAPDFQAEFTQTLIAKANFIYQHLELAWPRTNHLLSDACGLIWLGVYLQPISTAKTWLERGLRLLTNELQKQILPDGCAYEGSSAYHLLDTEMLVQTLWWMQVHGYPISKSLRHHGQQMLAACAGLLLPDGALPVFGDSDSGRWLALEADRHNLLTRQDPLGVLSIGAALFDETTIPIPIERQQSAVWLLGKIAEKTKQSKPQILFPNAKWTILQHVEVTLAITGGHTGTAGWGGHGHNDALSFELCVGDKRILVDSGSGNYTGQPNLRNKLRSTTAHNTIQVGNGEQNQIPEKELFRLNNEVTIEKFEVFEARACGRIKTPNWTQTREWKFTSAGTLRITDSIRSAETTPYSAHFHFAPGEVIAGDNWVYSQYPDSPNLIIYALQPATITIEIAPYAPAYDAIDEHQHVTFTYANVTNQLMHLLVPTKGLLSKAEVDKTVQAALSAMSVS